MKNKHKNKNRSLFFCLALPLILAVFFVFSKNVFADDKEILINEIHATENDDWVELYNATDSDLDLANNYRLYKAVSSSTSLLMRFGNILDGSYPGGTIIKSHGYYLIVRDDASSNLIEIADAICIKEAFTWSGSGYTIYFGDDAISSNNDPDIIDAVRFVDAQNNSAPEILNNKSIGRLGEKDTDNNSQDFTVQNPTPGHENKKFEEDSPVSKVYSDKIQITEMLPYPYDGEDEYIELYNGSADKIDLTGWSLHDASLSGEYEFSSTDSIDAKKYFVIYRSFYGFALNNSGSESVALYDPDKKEAFNVSYNSGKKGISYNFDGKDWHWSKFLTPGQENIFEKVPAGELGIDEKAYRNVYANFKIGGLSKNAKVTWDFGDGHRSYKQETRHKYEETGKYSASVKYSDGSEDVVKNFTVEVEKIPHPEVSIVAINANPKGSDTENETITLKNKSKKKVNLNGWSIATGWKTLYNHPISVDFEIKGGKEKEITREFSKFTLNNEKDRIELRYPDGKVAYAVKYKNKEGIGEGELYVKIKGGWEWQNTKKDTKNNPPAGGQETNNTQNTIISEQKDINASVENTVDENLTVRKKIERTSQLALNSNNLIKIKLLTSEPRVLGAETVREIDGIYHFTPQYPKQDHYAVVFLKNIFALINLKINLVLNFLF